MKSKNYKSLEPDWIFFGGAFDPPHAGHLDAVRIALSAFPTAQIVVVPALEPPVSKTTNKEVVAEFVDRVSMCVIALENWDRVQVSAIEENLPKPSYTANTLQELRIEYPFSKLAWMIGADQLASFQSWFEPRKILEMASLIVLARPGQVKSDLLEDAASMATSLGFKVSIDANLGAVLIDGASEILILDEAPRDISSTQARDCFKNNPDAALDFVVSDVKDYIDESKLYY